MNRGLILAGNNSLKLKLHSISLYKTLSDGLEWCGLLVDYRDVLSAVLTEFEGTNHSTGSIGEEVM